MTACYYSTVDTLKQRKDEKKNALKWAKKKQESISTTLSFYTTQHQTKKSQAIEMQGSVWVAQWTRGKERKEPELFFFSI